MEVELGGHLPIDGYTAPKGSELSVARMVARVEE
jgi:hypothetical protein